MSDVLILNADGMPLSSVPLSVVNWQIAMRLLFTDKVRVLKEYDDWIVRSQHIEMHVPSIIIMTEQVKWTKTLKYSRNNIYLRDNFTCQLQTTSRCKDRQGKSHIADLTLDHVIPKSHGGKTSWTNVTTCCKTCNSEKGNDQTIVPKHAPTKPTYYQILAKRKTMPIYVKDEEWKLYIAWPEHLVTVIPHSSGTEPSPNIDDEE